MSLQGSGVASGPGAMVLEHEYAGESTRERAEERAAPATSTTARGLVASSIMRRTKPTLSAETKSIVGALALAAVYGLPLGVRGGLASMLEHAVGVVFGLAAVAAFAAPAFYILLAHTGSTLPALAVVEAVRRCIGTTALVLAGLTPAATLLVVSTEGVHAAAFYAALGLAVAYALGLRRALLDLFDALYSQSSTDYGHALAERVAVVGFVAFALLLAARIWTGLLPLFGALS